MRETGLQLAIKKIVESSQTPILAYPQCRYHPSNMRN